MPRPRKASRSRRLFLTVDEEIAVAIDAQAERQQERSVRLAAELLTDAVRRLDDEGRDANALTEARRRIAQLETTVDGLRRRLRAREEADNRAAGAPRWEWPVAELLADEEWWAAWLPRLYELLGRDLTATPARSQPYGGPRPAPVVDKRGYSDLMTFLFPPFRDARGGLIADWRNAEYPALAWQEWEARRARKELNEGTPPPARPYAWEPTLRHVVRALCALEQASGPGADPTYGIRVEEELTGPWLRTLRHVTGETAPPELPRAAVP